MTTPSPTPSYASLYDPSKDYGTSNTTAVNTPTPLYQLPDGTYDVYGLGNVANQSIYVGYTGTPVPGGSAQGQKNASTFGDNKLPDQGQNAYTPAYKLMQRFAQESVTNPNSFAALQADLFQAGLYGTTPPTWGTWTAKDGDAIVQAFKGYTAVSQTGVPLTFEDWLSGAASAGTASQQSKVNPVSYTPTDYLQKAAQSAARATLGHELSESDLQKFVSSFHSQEATAQGGAAQAQLSNTATTPGDASPDPTSGASDYISQNFANEEAQHSAKGYMNAMLDMFLPSSSTRPTLNTDPYSTTGG